MHTRRMGTEDTCMAVTTTTDGCVSVHDITGADCSTTPVAQVGVNQ